MASSNDNDEKITTIASDGCNTAALSLVTISGDTGEKQMSPFDKSVWKAYTTAMEQIMTQPRVVKKCNDETISKCRTFLLSYEQHVSPIPDIMWTVDNKDKDSKKEALELSLRQQAERFQQLCNFTDAEIEFMNRCLVYMGDTCAKIQSKKNVKNRKDLEADSSDDIDPRLAIAVAWHKLKEMGRMIRENSMSTYMYILSNSGEGNNENDAFVDDALLEVVTCHDTVYEPSEKTVTIRLKSLIARGKIDEAEDIFKASLHGGGRISSSPSHSTTDKAGKRKQDNTEGRLRTFMPLMEHYCVGGNLTSTMRLYRQMQDCVGVHWDVESYSLLLSSLARFGYFSRGSDEEVSERRITDGNDTILYGPTLFDTLVSDMANDILELTEKTCKEMTDAFQVAKMDHHRDNSILDDKQKSQRLLSDTVVVRRVEIPKENGTCPITGVKLRLLALDEVQRQHVHDTLLDMCRTTTEEFIASMKARQQKQTEKSKNRKVKIRDTMQDAQAKRESYGEELLKFSKWLE
jgi:hypothetical protein